ncbi:MAG: hypothetical protein DWQ37_23610 [Planctomycetota bacterium]|nr:MAG: hypothetical protein DWQ37_23610 [Planctomycetota bacterium]
MTGRRISRRTRFVVAALLAALTCGTRAAQAGQKEAQDEAAQDASLAITGVRAGLGGRFKVGYWTPFEIEVTGGATDARGQLVFVTPDGDGVLARVAHPRDGELTIPAGRKQSIPLYAKVGQLAGDVTIAFRAAEGRLATRRYGLQTEGPLAGALPSTATLAVMLEPETSGESAGRRPLAGVEVARVDSLSQLPTEWWGYEGVDALVLTTSGEQLRDPLTSRSPQLAAIELWVRMGGKLVLSVGSQAETVLAADSPLAKLAPGTLETTVPLRQSTITMLETYAEATGSLGDEVKQEVRVPKLADVRGVVEAFDGRGPRDLPLVVRTPYGFGEVVFLALDLDRPPVAGWTGRSMLLEKLLRTQVDDSRDEDSGTLGEVTTLGFTDLAGQLRGALDQFEGVQLVPFWLVAGLILLYILCIGPLDYYLVKYGLRRMEVTWLTFTVAVVVFSTGAVVLAYRVKGHDVRVNQVDLVDFDAQSKLLRGTTWCNVYSPQTTTYNLSLRPDAVSAGADDGGVLFSWFGLTGTGFGGMDLPGSIGGDGASLGLSMFDTAYDYSARGDSITGVPIAVWSSKAFVGRWWAEAAGGVEADLSDDGRLAGTLENTLDVPLTDAVLLYEKWAFVLRTFEPGQLIDVETVDPQTSDTYLRKVTARGDRQVAEPFDQATFEVPRIVEMITAQGLAGGEKYTGLTNRYQAFAELSDLVRNGQAVLLGRVERSAAQLQHDGEPLAPEHTRRWTFYRYVFPVEQATPR